MKVVILCADKNSNYFRLNDPDLDIYTAERDAWTYNGTDPVICHAPCQQWSRLKAFARLNVSEKMLAYHCFELLQRNGGIFEHPAGSSFFKAVRMDKSKMLSVDQHWWNFPARKRTYLYMHQVKPLSFPLNLNAVEFQLANNKPSKSGHRYGRPEMSKLERSRMPIEFCQWLIDCVRASRGNKAAT